MIKGEGEDGKGGRNEIRREESAIEQDVRGDIPVDDILGES